MAVQVDSSGNVRNSSPNTGGSSLCHVLLDTEALPNLANSMKDMVAIIEHYKNTPIWDSAAAALPLESAKVCEKFSAEYSKGLGLLAQRMANLAAMAQRSAQRILLHDDVEIKGS